METQYHIGGANEPPGAVNEQNKVCERRKATQHIFKCNLHIIKKEVEGFNPYP